MAITIVTWKPTVQACDDYMNDRAGRYDQRAVRYRAAADWMLDSGLTDGMTVVDIGAGMTELAYCLMNEYGLRIRYIPVDGGIDGTDLNNWTPKRMAHFYVGLEILEHLQDPYDVARKMRLHSDIGTVFSTPDPAYCDVLAMDATHTQAIDKSRMEMLGFSIESRKFYGGYYSNDQNDSLFGTWRR